MTGRVNFEPGGYGYAPGVFQYSAGVAASPGHEIIHARFLAPVALEDGFRRISAHLAAVGRPLTAFCACELRSPAPFTESGFREFNAIYVGTLEKWGIFKDGVNPIARSNVCPKIAPPETPSFHAFSYTVPADSAPATCVVAGSGELLGGEAEDRLQLESLSGGDRHGLAADRHRDLVDPGQLGGVPVLQPEQAERAHRHGVGQQLGFECLRYRISRSLFVQVALARRSGHR